MSSQHHIDDLMRGRIIGKIEEGQKITDVAREFDIAHSVVSRLWKSFKTTGMCSRRLGGGRVRSTTPAEDRYIVLSAKRNRRTTAQQVANQFLAASVKQISRKTVARRLRGRGLYARRPVVCVPLTRQHRTAHFQWCREHHNWTEQEWACVLFSDESRFSLSLDCRRQLIWRESGTAYRPENIQKKDRYPTCSIMVWAGIMINGRTRLHVVANGAMTGQRYIDEVLLPHVRLFRGAVGDKFVFMDDNATCHRTLAVQDCLESVGIQRLVWPARSPDLIPIENVWDALGRQVAGRNYPPTNKSTLIRALTEEWDKLPQQLLDNVVQTSSIIFGGTESNSKTENNLLKTRKSVARELTIAEGLASTKKRVANGDSTEVAGAKRGAKASTSKRSTSCICPVCGANYYDENKVKEWVQCCGACSSWFHEECFKLRVTPSIVMRVAATGPGGPSEELSSSRVSFFGRGLQFVTLRLTKSLSRQSPT
ncbi:transposable element Tc1 transposase [Trichonephila clavipes]|nr:transposable element Tc1 transposase [Trichonephila clavipes]